MQDIGMVEASKVFKTDKSVEIAAAIASFEPFEHLLNASDIAVNTQGARGVSLLIWSLLHGNFPAMKQLLAHGADPALGDENGHTVMHLAAKLASPEALAELLSAGTGANLQNTKNQQTPIFDAIISDRKSQFHALIDAQADLNAQDDMGDTPLHVAAGTGQNDYAIDLLSLGADPKLENGAGQTCRSLFFVTPLSALSDHGRLEREKIDALLRDAGG